MELFQVIWWPSLSFLWICLFYFKKRSCHFSSSLWYRSWMIRSLSPSATEHSKTIILKAVSICLLLRICTDSLLMRTYRGFIFLLVENEAMTATGIESWKWKMALYYTKSVACYCCYSIYYKPTFQSNTANIPWYKHMFNGKFMFFDIFRTKWYTSTINKI